VAAEDHRQYLRILGVSRREPSLASLGELTAAHLTRVPFENVSKLYRFRRTGFRRIPELARFLDEIEQFHFGGTCYSNNYHLHGLLRSLGYQAALCGADMAKPDVHLTNLVTIDGGEYLVDAGYGGPFLAPMPRNLAEDYTIALGEEQYVLNPRDGQGRSRLELRRDGQCKHGYVVNPAPRDIGEFARVIDESFSDSATFMNALVLVRFFEGRSVRLQNLTLIESEGTTSRTEKMKGASRLPDLIEERFGIPGRIAREALAGLELAKDPWG